ncbi:hypothetical protein D3C75_1196900 [compost metagenome]
MRISPSALEHCCSATGWLSAVLMSEIRASGRPSKASRIGRQASLTTTSPAPRTRLAAGSTVPMVEFSTGISADWQSPDSRASMAP